MKRCRIVMIIATFILPTLVFWGAMLCLTSAAQAFPIPLGYYAYAYAENSSNVDISETNWLNWPTSPPVSASATVGNASALANCSEKHELYAEALASSEHGYAETSMRAAKHFTATFPQISIKFDYEIWASVPENDWAADIANAEVWAFLYDHTDNVFVWEIKPRVSRATLTPESWGEESDSGNIDIRIDLIPGHLYEFFISLWDINARADLYLDASASGRIYNIQSEWSPNSHLPPAIYGLLLN